MSQVEEIEKAVQGLSREELAAFREWFEEYEADAWDRQIEDDARNGRLDFLIDKALAEEAAGRVRDL